MGGFFSLLSTMAYICFRGDFVAAGSPVLSVHNRSFKYGDGLFETMKLQKGHIPLADLHFERLFLGMKILEMQPSSDVTSHDLLSHILQLAELNQCTDAARIRLAVYRTESNGVEYVIEAVPLPAGYDEWNSDGIVLDLYPYARKSNDAFANLKTANFLAYVMAGRYANEKKVDDCIVLNSTNKVSDTSKANIFLVREGALYTPALHQGCVNGVMRRFIIENLKMGNYPIHQVEVSEEDITSADEMFITNALFYVKWVKRYKDAVFTSEISRKIYEEVKAMITCYKGAGVV
jgi:branched-chain amino acid aminotransferase